MEVEHRGVRSSGGRVVGRKKGRFDSSDFRQNREGHTGKFILAIRKDGYKKPRG